jgi:hypothetical protein
LFACDGVRFQQQELYSRFETVEKENKPEAVIFSDGLGTLWHSLFYCGDFKVTKEQAYQGNSSIKISWDKSKGCEWIGFGNSFSNWTAVDMSEQRFHKALTFYVRAQDKVMGALPIVAALEDFSGGGSYHFIDTKKYLHGLQIDSVWRKVIVPLWDFPVREEEVDIHSIKQMKFQLEGGGSFYLDEIKIVDYTKEEFAKFRAEVEAMKPKGKPNQVVYKPETFDFDAWGHGKTKCQTLNQKGKNIHWTYQANNCDWAKWGINWNGWYQSNFRGITDKSVFEIELKSTPSSQFKITLEDFNNKKIVLVDYNTSKDASGDWRKIRVQLNSADFDKSGMQLDQIKQLLFEGNAAGEVEIKSIKFIER